MWLNFSSCFNQRYEAIMTGFSENLRVTRDHGFWSLRLTARSDELILFWPKIHIGCSSLSLTVYNDRSIVNVVKLLNRMMLLRMTGHLIFDTWKQRDCVAIRDWNEISVRLFSSLTVLYDSLLVGQWVGSEGKGGVARMVSDGVRGGIRYRWHRWALVRQLVKWRDGGTYFKF